METNRTLLNMNRQELKEIIGVAGKLVKDER